MTVNWIEEKIGFRVRVLLWFPILKMTNFMFIEYQRWKHRGKLGYGCWGLSSSSLRYFKRWPGCGPVRYCLNGKCTKKLLWAKQCSGDSKKDEGVCTFDWSSTSTVDGDTTCERGFSIRTLTKTGQRYWLGESLLAALMIIDVNGPDIEAVDEVR